MLKLHNVYTLNAFDEKHDGKSFEAKIIARLSGPKGQYSAHARLFFLQSPEFLTAQPIFLN